jgi:hypothetical protein
MQAAAQARSGGVALCFMILHLAAVFQGVLGVLGRKTCLSSSLF